MILTNEALHQKTSQELTSLLYEACYDNLEKAINEIDQKNFIDANEHLQKASDIVHRLGAGINYEAGIVADQLEQVYNYMADKIFEANVKKDKALIEEVLKLLGMIMTSWNEALKVNRDAQPKVIKQKTNAYEKNSIYGD
ncbi:flagellar export chaperone FliS [bacterium LRH843]|nr:flagellar export chaperone FliS [bacterium LRH843]